METNAHERSNRAIKAMKLIAVVSGYAPRLGVTALELAEYADPRDRELFAKLAGVNIPSPETWALVLESLRGCERILAQVRP